MKCTSSPNELQTSGWHGSEERMRMILWSVGPLHTGCVKQWLLGSMAGSDDCRRYSKPVQIQMILQAVGSVGGRGGAKRRQLTAEEGSFPVRWFVVFCSLVVCCILNYEYSVFLVNRGDFRFIVLWDCE